MELEDERELTLIGMVGMHDPPRTEVKAAVKSCSRAGVRLIVVTGDNRATAESVCRQIGVLQGPLDHYSSITGWPTPGPLHVLVVPLVIWSVQVKTQRMTILVAL